MWLDTRPGGSARASAHGRWIIHESGRYCRRQSISTASRAKQRPYCHLFDTAVFVGTKALFVPCRNSVAG